MLKQSTIVMAFAALVGCGEIARITVIPNASASQFAAIANDICLAYVTNGTSNEDAASKFAMVGDASFNARVQEDGVVLYQKGKDLVVQLQPNVAVGRTTARQCAVGADLKDPQKVLSELASTFPGMSPLMVSNIRGVEVLSATLTVNDQLVVVEWLPEGEIVLSRDTFELGTANDYRYGTAVFRSAPIDQNAASEATQKGPE